MPGPDFVARRGRVVDALVDRQLDGLLVTNLTNVRYLTGFTGSNAAVLVTAGETRLVTDSRYEGQAARETGLDSIVIDRQGPARLLADAGEWDLAVVGFESQHVTVAAFDRLRLSTRIELRPTVGVVEHVRIVKDLAELQAISRAAAIACKALMVVAPSIVAGVTERQIARALDDAMRVGGADDSAFPTIVAAGPNGAEPHHEPTEYAVRDGDLVTIDMGARLAGYHSDMTRTVAVGGTAQWQGHIYALTERAHAAGLSAVAPGLRAGDVDRAARDVIERAGFADRFVHGVGHGVGLEIHEAPMLFADNDDPLEPGMVITVEPGIYLPGRGGVRLEDTLVVTATGYDLLTVDPSEVLRALDAEPLP